MTHLEIRRLTAEDADSGVDAVATTIARAFADLEVAKWLVPDPAERVRILTGQFSMNVEVALAKGKVLVGTCGSADSIEVHAAAVWSHELTGSHSLPDDYDARLAELCGDHLDRFRILDEAFDSHHRLVSCPHDWLTYLAALPDHQGHGLGTALLDDTHRQLDFAGLSAFLIASNDRTRHLYTQHGYEPLARPLQLPDGPRMWPMWREPQTLPDQATPKQTTAPDAAES
jgi:GNAT superfamily N-acetyltransferase